jgi:antitoxin component of RelBE/YafQ-DinJ toxin-antitoxin module
MPKRRDKAFVVRVDGETLEGAQDYAEKHGVSLSAILRALMRLLVHDPPADLDFLPIEEETQAAEYRPRKRPRTRAKKKSSEEE